MKPRGRFHDWALENGPEALGAAAFAGQLLVVRNCAPALAMTARAREIVEEIFGPGPEHAESRLPAEAFRKAAAAARKAVRTDEQIDLGWRALLSTAGYESGSVMCDRMCLRVAPSSASVHSRFARPLPVHRDSWASCVMAQLNWWTPLYPLATSRTMAIWPDAFDQPVANTAREWDYDALARGQAPADYPLLPEALEAPPGDGEPVMIEPGEVLIFSAAHLHASRPGAGGVTRFGLDTRTVWISDVKAGRGAPDIDGPGFEPRWEMFERQAASPFSSPPSQNVGAAP